MISLLRDSAATLGRIRWLVMTLVIVLPLDSAPAAASSKFARGLHGPAGARRLNPTLSVDFCARVRREEQFGTLPRHGAGNRHALVCFVCNHSIAMGALLVSRRMRNLETKRPSPCGLY